MCMRSASENVPVIEFHASQDDLRHSGTACIHHCLLRVHHDGSRDMRLLVEGLAAVGDNFAHWQFVYLETVVLETSYRLNIDGVQALNEALRKVCGAGVTVQHRTFEEAHGLALRAQKDPSRHGSTSTGLLSPVWCLQEHALNWESR